MVRHPGGSYADGYHWQTKLGAPGDRLVRAASSTALVSAHAVGRASGGVSVLLIKKDPANAATVTCPTADSPRPRTPRPCTRT
ncbi:hypothetical protein [Streptomyces sp. NPDC001537]